MHTPEMFRMQGPFRVRLALFVAIRAYRGFCREVLGEKPNEFEQDPVLLSVVESCLRPSKFGGRVTRVRVKFDGGIVVATRLLSWGEQGVGFGEQWSIQQLSVSVKRKIEGRRPEENDPEDFEAKTADYTESNLQGVVDRWWGNKLITTFHPALGWATDPARIPYEE